MNNISPIKQSGKVSMNDLQLCMWLGDAAPGDSLEYHRGFLAQDIAVGAKQRLKEPERKTLERLAERARWAAERGFAHLVQRRIAADRFSYIVIARPRAPAARSPMALIELAAAA